MDRPAHRDHAALFRGRGRDDVAPCRCGGPFGAGCRRLRSRRHRPSSSWRPRRPTIRFPRPPLSFRQPSASPRASPSILQAVCSGFVFALATADKFLCSGSHRRALIIGAETFSRLLDWNDRSTCVLFGDGAGAMVLEAQAGDQPLRDGGVITTHLRSDGRGRDKLYVDGGPSTTGTTGHLRMEGREVFRHAVGMVAGVVTDAFAAAGIGPEELDWFVPHQANRRIIDASAVKLGIAAEQGRNNRAASRQHVGRLDPARSRDGLRGRADPARPTRDAGGDGGRLHMGKRAAPLVRSRSINLIRGHGSIDRIADPERVGCQEGACIAKSTANFGHDRRRAIRSSRFAARTRFRQDLTCSRLRLGRACSVLRKPRTGDP